jgi:hypothetical protein
VNALVDSGSWLLSFASDGIVVVTGSSSCCCVVREDESDVSVILGGGLESRSSKGMYNGGIWIQMPHDKM